MLTQNSKWWLLLAVLTQLSCATETVNEGGRSPAGISPSLTRIELQPDTLVVGKTVYVPIYSNIYYGTAQATFELTATLSVRNTDRDDPIVLVSVTYFDSLGSVVREYLEGPSQLGPMATADFVIERSDRSGGSGANFLVEWGAAGPVSEPHLEAIMIGQAGTAGISFVTQGRVVESSVQAGEDSSGR